MYLFAKAKEEIGLDVAIEYQGKVLTGNSLVVSGQEYTRYDMKLTAAEDCHEAQLTISCKEGGEILLGLVLDLGLTVSRIWAIAIIVLTCAFSLWKCPRE